MIKQARKTPAKFSAARASKNVEALIVSSAFGFVALFIALLVSVFGG